MATLYDFKPRFQEFLRPYADQLAAIGVTANQVTLAGIGLSGVVGGLLFLFPWSIFPLLLVPLGLLARMAFNAIDGMLAREHGQTSKLGALLNEVGDLVSDAAIYLPLAAVPGINAPACIAAAVLGLISEGAGLAAMLVGAPRRHDGPMGKSDRAAAFAIVALLAATGLHESWLLHLVLLAIAAAALWTIFNRMRMAMAVKGS